MIANDRLGKPVDQVLAAAKVDVQRVVSRAVEPQRLAPPVASATHHPPVGEEELDVEHLRPTGQRDVDAGTVQNTASVTGQRPDGSPTSASDSVVTDTLPAVTERVKKALEEGGKPHAALLIGVLDFALKKYFPQGGTVFIYGMTILLLLWRPQGLFGKPA